MQLNVSLGRSSLDVRLDVSSLDIFFECFTSKV